MAMMAQQQRQQLQQQQQGNGNVVAGGIPQQQATFFQPQQGFHPSMGMAAMNGPQQAWSLGARVQEPTAEAPKHGARQLRVWDAQRKAYVVIKEDGK